MTIFRTEGERRWKSSAGVSELGEGTGEMVIEAGAMIGGDGKVVGWEVGVGISIAVVWAKEEAGCSFGQKSFTPTPAVAARTMRIMPLRMFRMPSPFRGGSAVIIVLTHRCGRGRIGRV